MTIFELIGILSLLPSRKHGKWHIRIMRYPDLRAPRTPVFELWSPEGEWVGWAPTVSALMNLANSAT